MERGRGGNNIFLDPWWLLGPGHEVTANRRLWDLGAELVNNIPNSSEVYSRASDLTEKVLVRIYHNLGAMGTMGEVAYIIYSCCIFGEAQALDAQKRVWHGEARVSPYCAALAVNPRL